MKIRKHKDEGCSVLVLSGQFLGDPSGNGARDLRVALADLDVRHVQEVVMDIAGVTTMDAAGLGEIVLAFNSFRRRGVKLRLLNPTRRVRRLLQISKVDTVIQVHQSLDQIPQRPKPLALPPQIRWEGDDDSSGSHHALI